VFVNRESTQRHYACQWFHYGWAGIKRGERIATFAGHPVAPQDKVVPPFWIHDRFEHELLFSTIQMSPQTLPDYADALADYKPILIRGYPSCIYLIALYLLDVGRKDIHPKAVFVSSETLLSYQRKMIERAFDCKVYSFYANTEGVAHILQCSIGNFHIATESCFVEILNPDGLPSKAGELGEMICTGFDNQVMPLIRYRIGDSGVTAIGPCLCGWNTPILSDISGRMMDFIITPEGRHVLTPDIVFADTPFVKEAQIFQTVEDSILVKIIPRPGFNFDKDEKMLREGLGHHIGSSMRIDIEYVDHLPRGENGKFRFVISTVPVQIGKETKKL
jgi:phenylacetate-CoA ligase